MNRDPADIISAIVRPLVIRWAASVLLATAVLVGINLLWLVPVSSTVRSAASVLTLETADRVRTNIELHLNTAIEALTNTAEEIGIESDRRDLLLARLLKTSAALEWVAVADTVGAEQRRFDRTRMVRPGEARDYSRQTAFYLALEGAPNIGDVFVSPALEPHAILAVPLRRLGKIDGVLMAELNMRNLLKVVRELRVKEGLIYVVDRQGFQILHSDFSEVLLRKNFFNRPIVQKVILDIHIADGLSPDDRYRNERGVPVFAAGMPIAVAGGLGVFVEQPRRQALATERQMILLALATTLLGVFAFILIIRSRRRIEEANIRLHDLLFEIDGAGKMLVRRDLELSEANSQLREIDRIKSEFVSVAAHQLRTPLTGIKWTVNALLAGEFGQLSKTHTSTLRAVLETANRLVVLIGDLLNVARLEEGRYGLETEARSPEALIRSFAERFEAVAEEAGISFSLALTPKPLPAFSHDPQSLGIILENLLENAVQYTRRGGTISVAVRESDTALTISVSDTGIGIPRREQVKMFTKFFRAPNAQKLQPNGTGLGLYLAKNIVERNRGAMTFESAEGQGSTFTVVLPRSKLNTG